jgi:hypothetical protein
MKKKYEFEKYPKVLNVIAEELSLTRSEISKSIYKEGTEYYRGDDEHQISKIGILAELIARNFISEKNFDTRVRFAKMIDIKPVQTPDAELFTGEKKTKFDIKGVGIRNKMFAVNYKSHNNEKKKVDMYWFIHIDMHNSFAKHIFFKYDDVSNWEVKKLKYTEAYVCPI